MVDPNPVPVDPFEGRDPSKTVAQYVYYDTGTDTLAMAIYLYDVERPGYPYCSRILNGEWEGIEDYPRMPDKVVGKGGAEAVNRQTGWMTWHGEKVFFNVGSGDMFPGWEYI